MRLIYNPTKKQIKKNYIKKSLNNLILKDKILKINEIDLLKSYITKQTKYYYNK